MKKSARRILGAGYYLTIAVKYNPRSEKIEYRAEASRGKSSSKRKDVMVFSRTFTRGPVKTTVKEAVEALEECLP